MFFLLIISNWILNFDVATSTCWWPLSRFYFIWLSLFKLLYLAVTCTPLPPYTFLCVPVDGNTTNSDHVCDLIWPCAAVSRHTAISRQLKAGAHSVWVCLDGGGPLECLNHTTYFLFLISYACMLLNKINQMTLY